MPTFRNMAVAGVRSGLASAAASVVLALLLVGVPVLLVGLYGSPVPRELPSLDAVRSVLVRPADITVWLALFKITAWGGWLVFAWSVLSEAVMHVRGLHHRGPKGTLRWLAAYLVASVVLTGAATGQQANTEPAAVAATEPDSTSSTGGQPQRRYVVRQGDSLWRISERRLEDPRRWPEIYELNRARPQPGGGRLTDPDLIYPGWKLRIPHHIEDSDPPDGKDNKENERPRQSKPPQEPSVPATPCPTPPSAPAPDGEDGTEWSPSGLVAGAALTAAVGAAIVAWRRLRHRTTAASGKRGIPVISPPDPPRSQAPYPAPAPRPSREDRPPARSSVSEAADPASSHDRPTSTPNRSLVRQRQEIVHQLLACAGLGLTGPGGTAYARAAVLTLLADGGQGRRTEIVLSEREATDLFGGRDVKNLPGLVVVPTLQEALRHIELDLLARARDWQDGHPPEDDAPFLALVASAQTGLVEQMATVLTQGMGVRVAGLILGSWPAGTTCVLDEDGTLIEANDPQLAPLIGQPMFGLDPSAADDLIDVLDTRPTSSPPVAPAPPTPEVDEKPTVLWSKDTAPPLSGRESAASPRSPAMSDLPVRVTLLGPVSVTAAGAQVRPSRKTAFEVLTCLALHREGVPTDESLEQMWPDDRRQRALKRLHDAVDTLRRAVRPQLGGRASDIVLVDDGRHQLNPELVQVDLWQFYDALAQARGSDDPAIRTSAWKQAATLYGGPLAAGDYDWADAARQGIINRGTQALVALARLVEDDDPGQAIAYLSQAGQIDNRNEQLHQQLMRAQLRHGRRGAARTTYAQLEANLRDIDVIPDDESQRLGREADEELTRP